jgi:hypothetical protein
MRGIYFDNLMFINWFNCSSDFDLCVINWPRWDIYSLLFNAYRNTHPIRQYDINIIISYIFFVILFNLFLPLWLFIIKLKKIIIMHVNSTIIYFLVFKLVCPVVWRYVL